MNDERSRKKESAASRSGPETAARPDHGESIIALADWLETAPGRYVLDWELVQFDALVADIFGFNAVQIGLLEMPTLRSNRMPFVFAAGEPEAEARRMQREPLAIVPNGADPTGPTTMPPATSMRAQVLTHLEELPFASQSIDLLVLPHALEFADDPHRVLREVERVLMPEGHVVISGFNPASLWGARQLVGRTVGSPFLPSAGQFLALPRLKDWLKLLSFEVHRGHFGCYRPAFRSERWQNRFGFMETAGERWWSFFGAIYIVHAIKRVHSLRLIGPVWKERLRAPVALQPSVNRSRETCTSRESDRPRDPVGAGERAHAEA